MPSLHWGEKNARVLAISQSDYGERQAAVPGKRVMSVEVLERRLQEI